MEKGRVNDNGTLDLGVVARAAGYRPGTWVEIVVLSTGSVLITQDDSPVLLELKLRKLAGRSIIQRVPDAGT